MTQPTLDLPARHIVLTGFMGTGKSTVARYVAARAQRPFVDMDQVIETRSGQPIHRIFAEQGEAVFRALEAALLQELAAQDGLVIATGGGTLVDPANRAALGSRAVVICLQASIYELQRRLADSADGVRPLLAGEDAAQRIHSLLAARLPAYAKIPLQLDTTGLSPAAVGDRVLAMAYGLTETETYALPVTAAGTTYPVFIGEGVSTHLGSLLASRSSRGQVAVVTNETLAAHYAEPVLATVRDAGLKPVLVRMREGEQYKTLDTVRSLYEQFLQAGLDRHSVVVALGGGVVGDVAGFAAATYLRGVPFVQVPTSLLAMVDASVGGKVGVDLPGQGGGKNLVGAFKQPEFVLVDPQFLETLPGAEFRAGLAEVVKHGIIAAPDLFSNLETYGPRSLAALLDDAVRVKVDIVQADPFERDVRAHLNLGHTFAHAIEFVSGFGVRHGEAVAMGLVAASYLAQALDLANEDVLTRVEQLLARLGLPTRLPDDPAMTVDTLVTAMGSDKKRRDGRLRFVLPRAIGDVTVVDDVTPDLVHATWHHLMPPPG